MASPVLEWSNTFSQNVTSITITLDAAAAANELVFVFLQTDLPTDTWAQTSGTTGWTELWDDDGYACYYKYIGASEADPAFESSTIDRKAAIVVGYSGAADPATTAPEISTVAKGNSINPDSSASPTPASSDDYVFISAYGQQYGATGTYSAPSSYGNLIHRETGSAGNGAAVGFADRPLTTDEAQNPGSFNTTSIGQPWTAFTITVYPAGGSTYTLDAAGGSYTETGTAASLEYGRAVDAAAGSYAETGTAANLEYGRRLDAEAGSVTETGTAANLEYGRRLDAEAGAYTVTGTDATLTYAGLTHYTMPADAGSVSVTGTAANLEYGRRLDAATDAYAVTGTAASLEVGYAVDAEAGAVAVTGTAANLEHGRRLDAEAGSVAVTGTDATLTYGAGKTLTADAGSYAVTGTAATLKYGRVFSAEAGSVGVTGTAATLGRGLTMVATRVRARYRLPGRRRRSRLQLPIRRYRASSSGITGT
jgi:hypothetical protein